MLRALRSYLGRHNPLFAVTPVGHSWTVVRLDGDATYLRCCNCGIRSARPASPDASTLGVDWGWVLTGRWRDDAP